MQKASPVTESIIFVKGNEHRIAILGERMFEYHYEDFEI